MWLLPTRGRPEHARACLQACRDTGMTEPAVLIVDPRGGDYPWLASQHQVERLLPENWVVYVREWGMLECLRWMFREYPNEPYYGWLADDLRPETPGWDVELVKAAGRWRIADCNDDWLARDAMTRMWSLCGAFCWGGDLVRAAGFWAIPDADMAYTDDTWTKILEQFQSYALRAHLPDVMIRHLQFKNGLREMDETDKSHNYERDLDIYNCFMGDKFQGVVERLSVALAEARSRGEL